MVGLRDIYHCITIIILIGTLTRYTEGHGRLTNPPGRSTMSKYGFPTPVNDDDNGLNCGGFWRQWGQNGGRCGVCGDPWDIHPRPNEAGGKYASGIIVKNYREGETIAVGFDVTVSHRGYFEFRLCPHNDVTTPVTQECLDKHLLHFANGRSRLNETGYAKTYNERIVLPAGITCSQCVLQWKYVGGNNYGCDEINGCCVGCGNQEQFYACADISITH